MVETAIYVLLGFLAASLLALISAPAISRRAFRLAEARARLMAPASADQARADLDALRGRHAIQVEVIERRAAAAAGVLAQAQIELGRRATEIYDRDATIQAKLREIADTQHELDGIRGELREQDAENAALQVGHYEFLRQRDVAKTRLADAEEQIEFLEKRGVVDRATIANLQTNTAALNVELIDLKRQSESAADRAQALIAELEGHLEASQAGSKSLASRLADLEARHAAMKSEAEGRGVEAARLRERLANLEPRLSNSENTREALVLESSRQTVKATERVGDLQRLLALRREEIDRLSEKLGGAAARENELTLRVQALTAARADAEGALRAARAENEATSQKLSPPRNARGLTVNNGISSSIGDQMLRQAIIRLGRKLAAGGVSDLADFSDADVMDFNTREQRAGFDANQEPSRKTTHASEV